MATIPSPRPPRCLRHHVRMASCGDCDQQARFEQQQQPAGAR